MPQLRPGDAVETSPVSSFPLPKRSDESGTNEAATLHVGLLLAVRILREVICTQSEPAMIFNLTHLLRVDIEREKRTESG